MAYNVAIKSSKTAIRECLHRSKAIYACVGANRLKMAVFIRKSCVLRIDNSHPIYTILTHGSQLFYVHVRRELRLHFVRFAHGDHEQNCC